MGPLGRLDRCVYMCMCKCVAIYVCLGAAGGQATWHPDVEQEVPLETPLLFPTNCTPFITISNSWSCIIYYIVVAHSNNCGLVAG